jgi:uncharacterized membrane protein
MGIIEILGCEIVLFYIHKGGWRAYHHGKVQKKTSPTQYMNTIYAFLVAIVKIDDK